MVRRILQESHESGQTKWANCQCLVSNSGWQIIAPFAHHDRKISCPMNGLRCPLKNVDIQYAPDSPTKKVVCKHSSSQIETQWPTAKERSNPINRCLFKLCVIPSTTRAFSWSVIDLRAREECYQKQHSLRRPHAWFGYFIRRFERFERCQSDGRRFV